MKSSQEAVTKGMLFGTSARVLIGVEVVLLSLIVGAFLRTLAFCGYGFDPHHDYFALSPGLFMLDGLRPNQDFYTHYGPVDALIKAALLSVGGSRLLVLRQLLWGLPLLAQLLVCYGCELGRRSRCWLLALIGMWAIWEPSATGLRAALFWHPMAWSSDIAVVLICLLLLCNYHAYRNSYAAAFPRLSLVWEAGRGALVVLIFFTKFTIGLAMMAALLLSEAVVVLRFPAPGFASSRRWLAIAMGAAMALLGVLVVVGGPAGLSAFFSQAVFNNYRIFSEDNPFRLLIILHRYIFNPNTVLGLLVALVLFGRATRAMRLGLVLLTTILVITLYGRHMRSLVTGQAVEPDHVEMIAMVIAVMIVAYSVLLVRRHLAGIARGEIVGRVLPDRQLVYGLAVLPIGLFSLPQFYPVFTPVHVWWSVGTALPAAALVLDRLSGPRQSREPLALLSGFTLFNLLALAFTAWVLPRDIARNRYLPVVPATEPQNPLAGIRTVDDQAVAVVANLQQLARINPRLIILESNFPSILELLINGEALRARVACRVRPLQNYYPDEYPGLLACLQGLQRQGWQVIVTNNHNPKNNSRAFGKPNAVSWALVSQGDTPPFVRDARQAGVRFVARQQGSMTFWQLE
jgi:hypothetical protein